MNDVASARRRAWIAFYVIVNLPLASPDAPVFRYDGLLNCGQSTWDHCDEKTPGPQCTATYTSGSRRLLAGCTLAAAHVVWPGGDKVRQRSRILLSAHRQVHAWQ